MEPRTLNCIKHGKLNEIYCRECKNYICPRCIPQHASGKHASSFVHILHHAPANVCPKFDSLIESAKERDKTLEAETKQLVTSLSAVYPEIKEIMKVHSEQAMLLKEDVKKLAGFASEKFGETKHGYITEALLREKKKLEEAVKGDKTKEVIQLSIKIEAESEVAKVTEPAESMVSRLHAEIKKLKDQTFYGDVLASAALLLAKCQSLRLSTYDKDWVIDRTYKSEKMFISEDNLTYGCVVSSGYPAIIGTISTDTAAFAYEVIPHSLCCSGKEGFGIIERDKYIERYNADKTTPTVHEYMIGFMNSSEVKNMACVTKRNMEMDKPYYVRVSLEKSKCYISGPGLRLSADLKPGVAYSPCFSCGCTNNRLKIRPLSNVEESEEAPEKPLLLEKLTSTERLGGVADIFGGD